MKMVGTRRQRILVLAIFSGLLCFSIPFVRSQGSRYTHTLQGLISSENIPVDNHFPQENQRVLHGTSNVWEDGEHIAASQWRENHAMQEAAHDVFVLLKTGAETMWNRLPVHFDTTMKRFPKSAIFSDMGALLNGHIVWDVLQYLPAWVLNSPALLGYRVRRANIDDHWGWGPSKLALEGEGGGWETDRYKNIPAFIQAWEMTDGEMPWYLMIDGDTYIVTSTVAAAIKDRDPDAVWYLGHGVGANPIFAHGGSGILLSRGAMRAMFHEPQDSNWHQSVIENACQRAIPDCCGDSIVAYEFERLTGIPAETQLELEENGLFQGHPKAAIRLSPKMWCTPVGSFHHVSAWEVQELFYWEGVAMSRKIAKGDSGPLTYADFYEDFVEPFIVDERPGWYFEEGNAPLLATVYEPSSPGEIWDGSTKLDLVGSKEDCRRACALNETCLAWEWRKDIKCRIFLGEFSLGLGLNPYNLKWQNGMTEVAAGHMVERINAIHRNAPCRTSNSSLDTAPVQEPGWYVKTMRKNTLDGETVHELEPRPLPSEYSSKFNLSTPEFR